MTLALDKLPTPPVFIPGDGTVYNGVEYADDSQAWSAYYRDVFEPMKQRLAMAVTFAQHTEQCNTRYPVPKGGAWRTDCDCGLDAFLALLREKP